MILWDLPSQLEMSYIDTDRSHGTGILPVNFYGDLWDFTGME